jgi:N-sulfoglucosamine sulfohydrolase
MADATSDSRLDRRGFLGAAVAGAAATSSALAQLGGRRPPNILYLHSHDTGRYLEPYGHAVPAPNLRRLAEGGVIFRQAYNAAPTCSPSRASLLTGQCPHRNGMLGLAHRGFALTDYRRHILHTLRPADYTSVLAGLQHIADNQNVRAIGFDQVLPAKSTHVEDVTPLAVQWLAGAPKNKPFFLDVGFFETHREFAKPGPQEDPRYTLPPAPIPDTPQTRQDMAAFKASARLLDNAVGEVLRALESAGLAENTLVISTTDHGVPFPAMKCNLTDHGMGVSLIVRGPGFTGGKVCGAMVSQLDLYPTICDLAGVPPPAWLEGRSLLPLVRGEKEEINEEIFAEVNYHASYEPKRAVRTQRWKYIRNYDRRKRPVLPNCDDGFSKTLWVSHGWRERAVAPEQLFDLLFDPNETRNLAGDPASQAPLKEMRGRLDRWMRATQDPLLQGEVKVPKGARINDADGTSPNEPPRIVS